MTPKPDGPFDLGVEEEYQVVDPHTWELRSKIHSILERDLVDGVEDVRPEFLQFQVEAVTRICADVQALRAEVQRMRCEALSLAQELGLQLVASGNHPFSPWTQQEVTDGERYAALAEELQEVGRRLIACGLHVHVGIADLDLRILVMNRLRAFLPLLLALSASSPFFEGRLTGLHSHRTVLLSALPRTGIPPRFASWSDYQAAVQTLVGAGLLVGPSHLWWDARPSARYPTLEVRICDMPTRVETTVCLAAWVQALAVKLARDPAPPPLPRFFIDASKWQAARYGLEGRLLLRPAAPALPVSEWVEVLLEWLDDVAGELGSRKEVRYALTILREGTSADRQLQVWRETRSTQAVVAHLARNTCVGMDAPSTQS